MEDGGGGVSMEEVIQWMVPKCQLAYQVLLKMKGYNPHKDQAEVMTKEIVDPCWEQRLDLDEIIHYSQ